MSYVSGVTLCTSSGEDDDDDGNSAPWLAVSAWLHARGFTSLARVDDLAAGTKSMGQNIGIAGYNGFPLDEFAGFVVSFKWRYPSQVVLIIRTEEEQSRVWVPREGADPRRSLAVDCRCGAAAGQWCWRPESTWPLCDGRGRPDAD